MSRLTLVDVQNQLVNELIASEIKDDILYISGTFITVEDAGDYWKPEFWVNETKISIPADVVKVVKQCIEDEKASWEQEMCLSEDEVKQFQRDFPEMFQDAAKWRLYNEITGEVWEVGLKTKRAFDTLMNLIHERLEYAHCDVPGFRFECDDWKMNDWARKQIRRYIERYKLIVGLP